jgi:ribonuclease T1
VSSARSRAAVAALVAALATAGIVIPGLGGDDEPSAPPPAAQTSEETGTPQIPSAEESAEIGRVLAVIDSGEPLPYEEDGGTFQNREGLLPDQPLGYYREYTVETPGSPDRGASRLVIGEGGEVYYTDDHYASFREIDPEVFQ